VLQDISFLYMSTIAAQFPWIYISHGTCGSFLNSNIVFVRQYKLINCKSGQIIIY